MRFLKKLVPPDRWKLPVILTLGVFTGLILYSFYISKAPSYLGDKPETCVNCHIMAPQYTTWYHGPHREKTNCNDCHVPHNNIFSKYFFKARVKLARLLASLGYNNEIPYPDIGTKEKAQEYIGLDMEKLNGEKRVFLETIVPGWIKTGEEREKGYN